MVVSRTLAGSCSLAHSISPVRSLTDGEVFPVASVSSEIATLVFVRMSVAPLPVLRLLFLVRLGKFVGTSMVFREVLPPGAIFVVIPVVIVLVTLIVNPDLNASLLRYGDGHHCHWCGKDSSQK